MTCSRHYGQIFLVQRIFRLSSWCDAMPAMGEEIRSSLLATLHRQYLNKCNECNPGEAGGQWTVQCYLMVILDVSISSSRQSCMSCHERERAHGKPTPDIIQILSLKTNNQMQSYSPPALSLSYQSSLPEKTSSVFTYIYTSRGISSCSSSTSTPALHPEPQKWSSFLLFVSFISTNL